MTNKNNPNGLKVPQSLYSSEYNIKTKRYYVPETDSDAIYIGDAVTPVNNLDPSGKYPVIRKSDEDDYIRGIVIAIEEDSNYQNITYRESSTARYLKVLEDPGAEIEIQVNGTISTSDFGKYANIINNGGEDSTGISKTELNVSTISTDVKQLYIIDLADVENNNIGQYAKVRCIIYKHDLNKKPVSGGTNWLKPIKDQIDFTSSEPASPVIEDRYINIATGTSSVTGQSVTATYIYEWNGVSWEEYIPQEGDTVYDDADDKQYLFNGTNWVAIGATQLFIDLLDTYNSYSVANAIPINNNVPDGIVESNVTITNSGNDLNIPGSTKVLSGLTDLNVVTPIKLGDSSNILFNTANKTITGSVNSILNYSFSSGQKTGGSITDAGGATINVSLGTGFFRDADSETAPLTEKPWSGVTGQAIPVGTVRYVGVEWNAGSPQIIIKTSDSWDLHTDFRLGSVVNEAGTLHILNNPWKVIDPVAHTVERFYETKPFERADRIGKIILGEGGTRNITVTGPGEIYDGINEFIITAKNTAVSDTFDTYVGATLQAATQTQWDNQNYNNAGSLTPLTNNWYANLWFYIEMDDQLVMVYGTNQYATLGSALDAEAEQSEPTPLPQRLVSHGRVIGRLTFRKGGSVAAAPIRSAFINPFAGGATSNHLDLSNLVTGNAGHTQFLMADGSNALTNSTASNLLSTDASKKPISVTSTIMASHLVSAGATIDITPSATPGKANLETNGSATSKWNLILNTLSPKDLAYYVGIGIAAANCRLHLHDSSNAICFQLTTDITGTTWDKGLRTGIQSDNKGFIASQYDLLFRTGAPLVFRGKIDDTTGDLLWEYDIGIERDGDCVLRLNNLNAAVGKEWNIINQTGGGSILIFKNITDNKNIVSFHPNAASESLVIDTQGFLGLGTDIFTAFSKVRIFDGASDLLEIKTDGTVLSKVADYTPLVTSNNVLINKKYFDDNIPASSLWQEGAGFVSPLTATNSVKVGAGESYFIDSANINTSPTLPNIAYLDYANVFSVDQEIKKTAIIQSAKLKLTAAAGGGCVVEGDINSGSTSSGAMDISGGSISFARLGETQSVANSILKLDVINRGVQRYLINRQIVTTGTYNSLDIGVYNSFSFYTVSGNIVWNGVSNGVDRQDNITYIKTHASNILTINSQSGSGTQLLRTTDATNLVYGAGAWGRGACSFDTSHLYIGPAR